MLFAFLGQGMFFTLSAQDEPKSVPMQQVTPERPRSFVRDGMVLLQGVVKDAQGGTLPGAHVKVRESKAGAVADENGVFT